MTPDRAHAASLARDLRADEDCLVCLGELEDDPGDLACDLYLQALAEDAAEMAEDIARDGGWAA